MAIQYYCLDLETTGLRFTNNFHEICELSIIRATDRVQLTRLVRVDRPENSSIDALKIINRTANDLKKGIAKQELVALFEKFLAEDGAFPDARCLVGHNIVNFDRKFLWQLWSSFNRVFPISLFMDTMHMMRAYAKKEQIIKPALNLAASCELIGIKKTGVSHTAHYDTRNTFLLWEHLMEKVDYLEHIKRMPHSEDE